MGKRSDIKRGDRLSIRITDDVDELVLQWLNKQENRSKSILKIISFFAYLEKYSKAELVHLLTNFVLSDLKNNDDKGNILYNKFQMSDVSDVTRKEVSNTQVDTNLDPYDEIFGSFDKKKESNKAHENDLFSAIKSIIR